MLRLEALTKRFGTTTAVAGLDLEVDAGEFVTLLGPSGCGKTTTLRMIAGFETPTAGRILLDGRDITRLSPQKRGFGMVFQNYALFPHLNVAENVAFGLKTRGVPRAELARRVDAALALVDLPGYGKRRVQELSGGQQQRVALARALAPEPRVLLLDEPLSNLDAALRERTRVELRALLKRVGITAIFVTHDQEEAFALSDRIAVLEAGRLRQVDTPEALYQDPADAFVASFLGRANFLDGRIIARDGDALVCEVAEGVRWRVRTARGAGSAATRTDGRTPADAAANGAPGIAAIHTDGDRVRILARPESLRLGSTSTDDGARDAAPPDAAALRGTVTERRFAGPVTHYRVRLGELELLVHGGPDDARVGDDVAVHPVTVPRARLTSVRNLE
ncbi:MAG TPA: ABC transporter ATP-binding protein [Longimicrobiales bacterium]